MQDDRKESPTPSTQSEIADPETSNAAGDSQEVESGSDDIAARPDSPLSGDADMDAYDFDGGAEESGLKQLAESDAPPAEEPPVEPAAGEPAGSREGIDEEAIDSSELLIALSEAQGQVDTLTREKSLIYDQLLRYKAEFENFRKRLDRERTDIYQRARAEVLLELLPVVDNFERAVASLEISGGDPDALHEGVELIHRQLKDALTKLGLTPVESIGCSFDPNVHEAITVEPTEDHAENTVIQEFQRGYKLGDRLLRPAKVKVAGAPEP